MATAFEQILELKRRKEKQAQTEFRAARLALEQAARAVEQRRAEAEQFSRTLIARQKALFDEIENKVCDRGEIDDVREQIAALRGHEASLYRLVDDAEAARKQAAEALENARKAHLVTVKNVEKFEQLVEIEKADAAVLEQAAEDKEMEEFVRLAEPLDA